jgi:hypothetical protein
VDYSDAWDLWIKDYNQLISTRGLPQVKLPKIGDTSYWNVFFYNKQTGTH